MKPGDALINDRWITAVVDTPVNGQAVYVWPDKKWMWAKDVEPAGVSLPAIAEETTPDARKELVVFLLQNSKMRLAEISRVAGISVKAADAWHIAQELGIKQYKLPPRKPREAKPLKKWQLERLRKKELENGNLHREDKEDQVP